MFGGIEQVLSRISEIQQSLNKLQTDSLDAATNLQQAAILSTSNVDAPSLGGTGTSRTQRDEINRLVTLAAKRHGVSESLIHAVIKAESGYNPRAVSSAGAMGLMQLMPENCQETGVSDPYDMAENINSGVHQLKQMIDKFGRIDLALAAYNAGPGAVRKYDGIPPYRETQAYVRKILGWLSE